MVAAPDQTSERRWWKDATIYQIYPASFKDDNGDGLGDLAGIISKLDYVKSIGVDAIWICPMYDSPQVDMGYDIRDYENVYPPYGTVQDMETLIKMAHDRGLKVLLDLVINHTSNQHKWFLESRKSKDNPYRDWYIWRDAKYDNDGKRMPPNNWRGCFSPSAWSWDEQTQQYYLQLFSPEQPDLNWENETTRKAIYDTAVHFWLKKGIDGFRIDTVNLYSKGDMPEAPVLDPSRADQPSLGIVANGPRIHEFIRELYHNGLEPYGDIMTVGELPHTHTKEGVLSYVRLSDPQLRMVFQFDVVDLGKSYEYGNLPFDYHPYTRSKYKKTWSHMQGFLAGTDGWSSVFCENHDQARSVSRYADDSPKWRALSAKLLATQLACMTGTLFVYQGQEIGTINAPGSWDINKFIDIESINYVNYYKETKKDLEEARQNLLKLSRDHARLPLQWSNEENGGFSPKGTKASTWMPVHDDYSTLNVAAQEDDPSSVLNHWRKMLKLRKEHIDLFAHGEYECLDEDGEDSFCFVKRFGSQTALVSLNFSEKEVDDCSSKLKSKFNTLVSNYADLQNAGSLLRPWEARVYLAVEE